MSDANAGSVAGRSELGRATRHVSSRVIRLLIDPRLRAARNTAREVARRISRAPHRILYFHQVGDPYSHLAAQGLAPLLDHYDIELTPHVSAFDTSPNQPEPTLLDDLARRDCAAVAPHYGLSFPPAAGTPSPHAVRLVERALVAAAREGATAFAERAPLLGSLLWAGDEPTLEKAANEQPLATASESEAATREACALRESLGHYSGAMFYYAGEWYWGIDRLYHLEQRLRRLGAATSDDAPLCFPRHEVAMKPVARASEITLEVFPSLRSPYTAIGFDPSLELAKRTGVSVVVRPVLPMVMRGVPVTFSKGVYIMSDAKREAANFGIPFGRVLDPIGEPVRRAYSLWPWARDSGRGSAYLSAFLRAAFCEGVDTSVDAGLRHVVERAGLSWQAAGAHLGDSAWEAELEENRLAMVDEMGQWGVPSFRLRGPDHAPDLCCWGQDRLWLLAREIQARGA